MGVYHQVGQGEHLPAIALTYGFPDFHKIWDDAGNAALRKQRQNPNVLNPGDKVFIPDKQEKEVAGQTEKRHRFQVRKPELKLKLVLKDMHEKPVAHAQCELRIENEMEPVDT